MQTLPQPASSAGEARAVSEILARSDPADMPAMRAGLSFLTSAGAELAMALERAQQENQRLREIVAALPPEWVEAATTGGKFPDFGALRAEVEVLKDERIDLRGQLVERDQLIQALKEQIAQLEAEAPAPPTAEEAPAAPSAEVEELTARLAALQAESDELALARAQAEDSLRASQAELADVEQQLAGLRASLLAVLPEDAQAQLAVPAEETVQDARQRRAMLLGGLAAAISVVGERSQQSAAAIEEANARGAALQEELEVAYSTRVALEADLGEKAQALDELQSQIESLQLEVNELSGQVGQLQEQVAALQAELETANAAKADLEAQLLAREGELAELNQQIDSVGQQLRAVLPEETLAQLAPAEEESEAGEEIEGEEGAVRGAAPKMLGLGALAAGVAAAVDLSAQKSAEAAEAAGQLAALEEAKASLEQSLQEKEQAVAELSSQIEALNSQLADAQAQIDASLAAQADLQAQLTQSEAQLSDLQGQVDGAVGRLGEIVPVDDLPELEASAEEGAEGAPRAVGLAALVAGVARVVDRRQSNVAELEQHVQSLQTAIDELSREKADLEAALAEKTQELAGYNDYVLSLQGQVNQLAAEKQAAEADLQVRMQAQAEVEAQFDTLTAQINDLTAQVEALSSQVADLQAQLEASAAAKAEVEQALQQTQEQLAAAQADLAQIEEESQRALGSRAAGLGAVGAGVAAVAALREREQELSAANEQVLALQGQVNELAAMTADLARLQVQVEELATARETLTAELSSRDAELADLRSQLEALQAQLAGATGERSALQAQLEAMEETIGGLETQRSSARLELAEATELSEALARLPAIKSHAASAAIVAGVQPALSPRVQALTDVKGIGSVYQQRLYNAGIGTYWELASAPDEELIQALEIPELQRDRFDAVETRADAYAWAQKTDTVGLLWDGDHVDDFESLPGLGKTFEKRLYEAGITTFEQLAACDLERLKEIVRAPAMREVPYEAWYEHARQATAQQAEPPAADA